MSLKDDLRTLLDYPGEPRKDEPAVTAPRKMAEEIAIAAFTEADFVSFSSTDRAIVLGIVDRALEMYAAQELADRDEKIKELEAMLCKIGVDLINSGAPPATSVYGHFRNALSTRADAIAELADRDALLEEAGSKITAHYEGEDHGLVAGVERLIEENESGFRDYQDMKIEKALVTAKLEEAYAAIRWFHGYDLGPEYPMFPPSEPWRRYAFRTASEEIPAVAAALAEYRAGKEGA